MSKNKNKKEVVEVIIEDSVSKIDDFKLELSSISESNSSVLQEITESIQYSTVERTTAIDDLSEFIQTQENLAKPYGFFQNATSKLAKLPIIGSRMESAYKDIKQSHLESQSIKEVIYNVFDKMIENGNIITDRVKKFHTLRTELKESLERLISLRERMASELETLEEDSMDQFEFENLLLSLNNQIVDTEEEIKNLYQIEMVTKGISKKIVENTPSNKERLLRKIAAFTSISEANDHLNSYRKLVTITRQLDYSIQEGMFDTLENVIDSEEDNKKELEIAKKRRIQHQKRTLVLENKIADSKKEVKQALAISMKESDIVALEYKGA